MKVPLSWLKDFVDIQLPVEDLARKTDCCRVRGGRHPLRWFAEA
jgi:hypothetical protein